MLLAGDNFGCGSSREHAPWALADFGFRAVISTSFADIFRNNSLKNGLLPVIVDAATHRRLLDLAADPSAEVTVDLDSQTVRLPDGSTATFPIDGFSKTCLLEGVDQLGYLLLRPGPDQCLRADQSGPGEHARTGVDRHYHAMQQPKRDRRYPWATVNPVAQPIGCSA